ncbi:MAG: rhomboid family intramembrane serine protease, partial [Acholeplasmataceae bacterium]
LFSGGFSTESLIESGALYYPLTVENQEYYRMVTAMFLHGGILHFVLNMLVLYYLGGHLERLVGPFRYTILYFASGLLSSVFVLLFSDPRTITIGASGALFGIIGGLLMLTFLRPTWFSDQAIRSIRQLMVINLILTFTIPNISIAGHVGGLIMGIALFFMIAPEQPYIYRKILEIQQEQENSTHTA